MTLISLRRMGKTGLLKHVRYHLEHSKKPFAVIYVDLLPTMSGNEMLNSISSALIQTQEKREEFSGEDAQLHGISSSQAYNGSINRRTVN